MDRLLHRRARGGVRRGQRPGDDRLRRRVYKFRVNTVAITDSRIGLRGQGKAGHGHRHHGQQRVAGEDHRHNRAARAGAAPVSGFTLYGWDGGASVVGLEYGDRYGGTLTDISCNGFNQSGGIGFWFHDATALSEGSYIAVLANSNTDDFVFQGNASSGSFDYSHIALKVTSTTANVSGAILKVIGHMQLFGCYLQLSGNIAATTRAH